MPVVHTGLQLGDQGCRGRVVHRLMGYLPLLVRITAATAAGRTNR